MNQTVLIAPVVLLACGGLGRPLTPRERKVRIADGSQSVSIRLSERCEAIAMDEMNNVTVAEIEAAAVEKGGNVAQILYETDHGPRVTSDVRFWKCPE